MVNGNGVLRRYDPLVILLEKVLCIISMVLQAVNTMELPIEKELLSPCADSLDRNTEPPLQKTKNRKNNSFLIIEQRKKHINCAFYKKEVENN